MIIIAYLRIYYIINTFVYVWLKSVLGNIVSFRVHAPNSGAFLLDIFANSVTPKEYLTGEPMKFKSVCKFKIICEELQTVMVPLPDCASGEWGPTKATRLFGLIPISHQVYTMHVYLNVKWHMHKFNDYLVYIILLFCRFLYLVCNSLIDLSNRINNYNITELYFF